MINVETVSNQPMTMAETRKALEDMKKRDGELNFRANKTYDYLLQFALLDRKHAEELYKKIDALNVPRLKPEHIVKIVDLLPSSVDDLNVILQGYTITINNENKKKIVAAVSDFLPKKKAHKE